MCLFFLVGPLLGSYLNEYLWFFRIGSDSDLLEVWSDFDSSQFEACSMFIWFVSKFKPSDGYLVSMAILSKLIYAFKSK